jgi:hypothetical protein
MRQQESRSSRHRARGNPVGRVGVVGPKQVGKMRRPPPDQRGGSRAHCGSGRSRPALDPGLGEGDSPEIHSFDPTGPERTSPEGGPPGRSWPSLGLKGRRVGLTRLEKPAGIGWAALARQDLNPCQDPRRSMRPTPAHGSAQRGPARPREDQAPELAHDEDRGPVWKRQAGPTHDHCHRLAPEAAGGRGRLPHTHRPLGNRDRLG